MQDYSFRLRKKVRTRRPVFVCGLPDSGLVAKIAVDHLIEFLSASRVADVYSPHLPPQVLIRESGACELVSHQLYYSGKANLMIYTGDSQPVDGAGAYRLSEFIVGLARRYRAKEIVILAALIKGSDVPEPQVVAAAESASHLREYESLGVKRTGTGSITWMHGLILGEAIKSGLKVVCLSGETRGELPDPRAAIALLKVLEKRLGMSFGTSGLEARKEVSEGAGREYQPSPEERGTDRPTYIG